MTASTGRTMVTKGKLMKPQTALDERTIAVAGEIELEIEELEEVIAPYGAIEWVYCQHNETFISDEVELTRLA
jgi:hypothetical protein